MVMMRLASSGFRIVWAYRNWRVGWKGTLEAGKGGTTAGDGDSSLNKSLAIIFFLPLPLLTLTPFLQFKATQEFLL